MSDQTEDEELAEGTLLSHLIELRSRLLVIAAAVVIAFVVLLPFSRDIFTLVSEPLREVLPGNAMIATAVASPLLTPFKLTFFSRCPFGSKRRRVMGGQLSPPNIIKICPQLFCH